MDLSDGEFGEDFEDFAPDASDTDNEDFGVEEGSGVSVDDLEDFVRSGDWICEHGL